MKMGIIAAGTGERLVSGGVRIPKPLVPIAGQPLIARAIAAGVAAGADAVACIVNDLHPEVARFLRAERWPVPVAVVVKTTPSSMESLFALAPHLDDGPFLLSTVDAVCAPQTVARFVGAASALEGSDGALALTRHVDDEKPLWAAVDGRGRVTALGATAAGGGFVTAGVYYFTPGIFTEIGAARRAGLTALRRFLAHLTGRGYRLHGVPVGKTVDVDRPADIAAAEALLREGGAA
jgi:NDP-sugar pyrophosphorylase family protein